MSFVRRQIDWSSAVEATREEYDRIKTELEKFILGNQEWGCYFWREDHPPQITMKFYLRGKTVSRKRGRLLSPFRAQVISEEEMDKPADFVAKVMEKIDVRRIEKDSKDYLVYRLRVNFDQFVRERADATA